MKYIIGQSGSYSKTLTEYDVYSFAGICGDNNPVHINKVKAEQSIFKRQVVHGALISSFISTVLGMIMPGPGTIYLRQYSTFKKPVYFGDTITAKACITAIDEKNRALIETKVFNQNDECVLDGEAFVILPTEEII